MNPGGPAEGTPPTQPTGAQVQPTPERIQSMNQSAAGNASPASGGQMPCQQKKKSWFAIRVVKEDDSVVEGLTLKLKIPDLGDTDRVTSKGSDPIKIEQLEPGGKGDVRQIDCGDVVWEAVGDIT